MPNHQKHIDALRGLAAAAVLFTHTTVLLAGLAWRVGYVAALGAHGVQLFYMLSAITLALSWDTRSGAESSPVRAFYIRRLFRIAPMFWLAGLVYVIIGIFSPAPWRHGAVDGHSVFLTAVFAHGWSPDTINAVVPGGWSIADEMTFYLFFPLLASILTNLRRTLLFFAISVLFALIANQAAFHLFDPKNGYFPQFLYYWLPNQLPIFALGFVTYRLMPIMRSASAARIVSLFCVSAGVGLFLAAIRMEYWSTISHPFVWRDLVAGLGFMALILALSAKPVPLLVNRVTMFLGKVSFSFYLVQFAILQAAPSLLGEVQAPGAFGIVLLAGLFVILLLLTMAVAAVTYATVEKPFMKMGQRLAGQFASSGSGSVVRTPA